MALASVIALGREQAIWVKASGAAQGVFVTAFATAHSIYHTGAANFEQSATVIVNAEKRNSRTRLKPIRERFPAGTYSFPTYAKPASTAGSAPETDALLLAAFGVKTTKANTKTRVSALSTGTASKFYVTSVVNRTNTAILVKKGTANYEVTWVVSMGATQVSKRRIFVSPQLGTAPANAVSVLGSVTYSLIATNPGDVAILKSEGHTTFRQIGCTANKLTINVKGTGLADFNWEGNFMRQFISPSDTIATGAAISGSGSVTNMKVQGSANRFMQGSLIKIGSEVIYVSLDPASNAVATVRGLVRGIKSTTATKHVGGTAVVPWVPSSKGTSRGLPTPGYKGYVRVQSTNINILDAQVVLTNNEKMMEGEKNNQPYVISYSTPGFREVSGSLKAYFRTSQVRHFQDAKNQVLRELIIPVGDPNDGGGRLISIQLKQVTFQTPKLGGEEEITEDLAFQAFGLGNTSNDEIRVAFI